MKHLNGWRIELGELESNEKFHEDGGWINGVLTNGEKTFSVGGGWIHNQDGADHYNSCHGMSYSGGGPNPYLANGALEAGGFESYKGNELGDIDEVYSHFGFDTEDNPEECEVIYDEILKLNGKAWNDLDLSDNAEYQALMHSVDEVIAELKEDIEENYEDHAKTFVEVAKLKGIKFKGIKFKIEETGECEEEIEDTLYKTVSRQLLANDKVIGEWTICAQGWYVSNNDNPNYSIGWNVTENTDSGNDGINYHSTLHTVLSELDLLDEAKELPDIDEPAHEEESENGEYIVQVRNTYTPGMEDWETRARFDTEEGAKFYIDEFWRNFYSANSSNSYGPETRILHKEEILEEVT